MDTGSWGSGGEAGVPGDVSLRNTVGTQVQGCLGTVLAVTQKSSRDAWKCLPHFSYSFAADIFADTALF